MEQWYRPLIREPSNPVDVPAMRRMIAAEDPRLMEIALAELPAMLNEIEFLRIELLKAGVRLDSVREAPDLRSVRNPDIRVMFVREDTGPTGRNIWWIRDAEGYIYRSFKEDWQPIAGSEKKAGDGPVGTSE